MSDEEQTSFIPEEGRKIGPALERARTDRGLSLEDVEQATKIRKRYLVGLEREDYGMLPDAVYVQGFLKTYANYLGLDGDEMSQEFRSRRRPRRERQLNYGQPQRSDFDQPLINPGGVTGARRRRVSGGTIITIMVAVLVLALIIGGLYFIGRGSQAFSETNSSGSARTSIDGNNGQGGPSTGNESPDKTTDQKADPDAKSAREPVPETTSEAPAPDTLRAAVHVEERPSWLEIRADGRTSFAQIAEPGFSETFEARRELSVTTGDAGAVSVSVNGQDVGVLGESGQVLTRDWTLKTSG
ncbi:MAG: helix-turn-helix domain-containing protein [Rubrobacteraceae bacterium]|nr:helix-turn-helix domain-containing protein [Rubrobacter sp.]